MLNQTRQFYTILDILPLFLIQNILYSVYLWRYVSVDQHLLLQVPELLLLHVLPNVWLWFYFALTSFRFSYKHLEAAHLKVLVG